MRVVDAPMSPTNETRFKSSREKESTDPLPVLKFEDHTPALISANSVIYIRRRYLTLSHLSTTNTVVPQTEKEENEKEAVRHQVVRISSIKRFLLAVVSFASMVLGTYLIVSGVLAMEFGPLSPSSLAIFPSGRVAGDVVDTLYIVAGIGLWILGSVGLVKSFKKVHRSSAIGSIQT